MSITKATNKKPIISNAKASLFDIGDGITYFELHSKLNIIEDSTLSILDSALDEVENNHNGMIVGTEADHFSVGLNLILLLEHARSQEWNAITKTLRNLQKVCTRMRLSSKPVVAAATGMALGGGCEFVFGADATQAFTNSKLGLVELRVGLIPGGGGTTEMAFRCLEKKDITSPIQQLLTSVQEAFDTIRQARISENCEDAVKLCFLRQTDRITNEKDNLLHDAREFVISLRNSDYQPPESRNIFVLGQVGIEHLNQHIQKLREDDNINEYEQFLAEKLAYVICGGNLAKPQYVPEQHLLDLEHEIFLGLCGETQTHTMIEGTLNKGKK